MIRIHDLPEEAALLAIRDGDFPASITGSPQVAVVMTQSWCPDWLRMRSWMRQLETAGEPASHDIDVYVLVYNKISSFDEFMRFKESSFGNRKIPYVRYYSGGSFLGDSNQVSTAEFLARFAG